MRPHPILRLPLIGATLLLILLYGGVLLWRVPNPGFDAQWQADGLRLLALYADHAAAQHLRIGDVMVAIDGMAVQRTPWRWLYPPGRSAYTYTVQRGDERLTVTLPVGPLSLQEVRARLSPGLTALGAWVVGSLILMLASRRNQAAWQVGTVTLGLASALAAAQASLYGVPFAGLLSTPWLPVLAVAFAHLALLPRTGLATRLERHGFGLLYALALTLALCHLGEMFFLLPQEQTWMTRASMPLADVSLLAVGLALLLNPLLLGLRAWRLPSSTARDPARLLLVFTALAVLPLTLLTLLPRVLVETPLLPWEAGLALLLLIPGGYGYILYRHHYLGLALAATRTLTLLALALFFLLLYLAASLLILLARPHGLPDDLATPLAVAIAGAGLLLTGGRCARAVQTLVCGSNVLYIQTVRRATTRLTLRPERATLQAVFAEMLDLLEVRQAVLLMAEAGCGRPLYRRGVFDTIEWGEVTWPQTLQLRPLDGEAPSCFVADWIEVIAPLLCDGTPVGMVLLGPRTPDLRPGGLDLAFIEQMAGVMAMAAATLSLFDASRLMSRRLLHIGERERAYIAALLHDEPLQALTWLSGCMDALAHRLEDTGQPAFAADLWQQRQTLVGILQELRDICAGLHSLLLDLDLGLAVEEAVERFARTGDVVVHLQIDPHLPPNVAVPLRTALYHVLLEALANVRKHANATSVSVTLTGHEGILLLTVADDGDGMALDSLFPADLLRQGHFGLLGMVEWAKLAQGQLSLDTGPGAGVRITLSVPLTEAQGVPPGHPPLPADWPFSPRPAYRPG